MAYASSSDVAALCRDLVSGCPDFSASSVPSACQVTQWLSSGCSIINTRLAAAGYSPIGTTSGAYEMVRDINALFGAWRAERSRAVSRTQASETTRADMFRKDFNDMLEMLLELDLTQLGVSLLRASEVFAGGISVSDKAERAADPDRVPGRFQRGQFRMPGRDDPTGDAG